MDTETKIIQKDEPAIVLTTAKPELAEQGEAMSLTDNQEFPETVSQHEQLSRDFPQSDDYFHIIPWQVHVIFNNMLACS